MLNTFGLMLTLIHTAFLAAIALRLAHIGYPSATVFKLCAFSIFLWPAILLIGIIYDHFAFLNFGGLTGILTITTILYARLEFNLLIESDSERSKITPVIIAISKPLAI